MILLETGYSVPEIAERLIIADVYVRNIYKRFRKGSTLEAKKMVKSRIPKMIQKFGEEFISNPIIPLATKPYTLIMDNLSIHKNKACLELLKKHQIEVIFQPT